MLGIDMKTVRARLDCIAELFRHSTEARDVGAQVEGGGGTMVRGKNTIM